MLSIGAPGLGYLTGQKAIIPISDKTNAPRGFLANTNNISKSELTETKNSSPEKRHKENAKKKNAVANIIETGIRLSQQELSTSSQYGQRHSQLGTDLSQDGHLFALAKAIPPCQKH